MNTEIMTKENPRWLEFCDQMQQLEFGHCYHDFNHAFDVLNAMGGIDIKASLDYFKANSGHCDCETIFNLVFGPFDPNKPFTEQE